MLGRPVPDQERVRDQIAQQYVVIIVKSLLC